MKINEAWLDEDNYVNKPEQIVESHDRVEFHGFESLYNQTVDNKYHLLYSIVQTKAKESFDNFQKNTWKFEEFHANVRSKAYLNKCLNEKLKPDFYDSSFCESDFLRSKNN